MTTYADLTANMLNEAANFFERLADTNSEIKAQMDTNVTVFRQMAEVLQKDPEGYIDELSHGQMAGRLLNDAADFFETIGKHNEPIQEQMQTNATVFRQLSEEVANNPTEPVGDE